MKHVFELNGLPRLRLMAESEIELLMLKQMAEESAKGVTTNLVHEKDSNQFVLEVGK